MILKKGSIKIDGQNIKDISLKSLRKNLSLVSQDIILFDDTIKNNIAYAKNNASMMKLKKLVIMLLQMNLLIKCLINMTLNWRKWYKIIWRSKTKNFNS